MDYSKIDYKKLFNRLYGMKKEDDIKNRKIVAKIKQIVWYGNGI